MKNMEGKMNEEEQRMFNKNIYSAPETIKTEDITRKDIEEILILRLNLSNIYCHYSRLPHPLFNKLAGLKQARIGSGTENNTVRAINQLSFAMAMTRHPLIIEMTNEFRRNDIVSEDYDERLIEAQILKGYKILDLGCGRIPILARVCRGLGADVWTADVIPAKELEPGILEKKARKDEEEKHICTDLGDAAREDKAVELLKKTGGEFNLVTEAHLKTGTFIIDSAAKNRGVLDREIYRNCDGSYFAFKLLKDFGLYFDADRSDSVKVKRPGDDFDRNWKNLER
jgi:hypothetical protein